MLVARNGVRQGLETVQTYTCCHARTIAVPCVLLSLFPLFLLSNSTRLTDLQQNSCVVCRGAFVSRPLGSVPSLVPWEEKVGLCPCMGWSLPLSGADMFTFPEAAPRALS